MEKFEGVFYHGSDLNRIEYLFKPSIEGTWGSGFYMADREAAEIYANDGLLAECKVSFSNPYHHKVLGSHMEEHGELPCLALVQDIFDDPASISGPVIDRHSFYFGREIQDRLLALGHNGLVITYEQGGCQEIVAYPKTMPTFLRLLDAKAEHDVNFLPGFVSRHIIDGISITKWLQELAAAKDLAWVLENNSF